MSESIKQEEVMENEGDFDKGFDSSIGDDDKTFAAMGVAKTIGTVSSHSLCLMQAQSSYSLICRSFLLSTLHQKFSPKWNKL